MRSSSIGGNQRSDIVSFRESTQHQDNYNIIGSIAMRALLVSSTVLPLLLLHFPLAAQQFGPENGALVIVGGAMRDQAIVERFLDLAGGPDAPIVLIPTAGGAETYDQFWRGRRQFMEAGASHLFVLHTYDPEEANTEGFVEPIKNARGVWFGGGRQWRLADAYLGTRVHEELWALLERGGVIGGSSAGATIQGSYLARGDTETNTVMMGDHVEGMAFLKNVTIDQHLLRRNRHFDLIAVVETFPEMLGIGLDENTAIVVQGDRFDVIGQSYVAIFDHDRSIDTGGSFYFLAPGDSFDLVTREAFRPRTDREPLDRVVERRWPRGN
jgi:cyanophycinase